MDCTVHGVAKSRTQLIDFHFLTFTPFRVQTRPPLGSYTQDHCSLLRSPQGQEPDVLWGEGE